MQSKSQSSTPNDDEESSERDPYAHLDAEKLLIALGKCGRLQIVTYLALQILGFFYVGSMMVMSFIQEVPVMFCDVSNLTQPGYSLPAGEDACQCYLQHSNDSSKSLACGAEGSGTVLTMNDTLPVNSMLKYYGFECSSVLWKEAGMYIFTVGAMISVPVMCFLADRFGRRPLVLITTYLSVIFNIATPFMPNFYLFLALRFLVGAMSDSYLTIAANFSCEVVVEDGRDWMGLIHGVAWVLGYLYVGVVAHFVPISNWKYFYLVVIAPGLLTIPFYWIIPESPHWLIAHGKVERIKEYIQRSEKWNNVKVNLWVCQSSKDMVTKSRRERRKSVWRVLKNKTMVAVLLINGIITFVHQMYYFTLTFTSVKLSKNPFLGYALSGIIEIPAGISVIPLMRFFGRRTLTVSTLILQGAFVLVCPYTDTDPLEWVKITFNLLGKLANGISNVAHPLLISEMMPTMVRNLMFSLINVPQSLGIILASFIKYMTFFGYKPMPILILCAASILAGLLALILPETKGKPMPEDLVHMDPGPVLWEIKPSPVPTKRKSMMTDDSEMTTRSLLGREDSEISTNSLPEENS